MGGERTRGCGEEGKLTTFLFFWSRPPTDLLHLWKLLAGNELQELIKEFLASIENDEMPSTPPTIRSASDKDIESDSTDHFWWQKALRWCPRGLLDLVNSRACRGMY